MIGRIRTVKPEWLDDEKLGAASDAARILSIGLLLLADDHGRGRAHPLYLASHVWAYGNPHEVLTKVSGGLHELRQLGFLRLYEIAGQSYFEVRNWARHQKVQHPSAPRVPAPQDGDENEVSEGGRESGLMRPEASGTIGENTGRQEGAPGASHETLMRPSGESHEVLTPDLDLDLDLDLDRRRQRRFVSTPPSAESTPRIRPTVEETESLIAASEAAYPAELVRSARDACARCRKTGRMQARAWLGVLTKLAGYPPAAVVAAMEVFTDRYSDGEHDESYLIGIVRKESERANRKNGWQPPTTRAEYAAAATSPQELASMFGNLTDEDRARVERLGMRGPNG